MMIIKEKLTYVEYSADINLKLLTLNSLLFNIANPTIRDPYVHE